MNQTEKNYLFYKKEEKNLIKKYPKEYIVIHEEKVVFHNNDLSKVIEYAKKLEAGTYIIQKCETDEEENFQTFPSRVSFSNN